MITQAVLDFFRGILVSWLQGANQLANGIDATGAGNAVGSVTAQAGHVIFLVVSPDVWGAVATAWAVWIAVWLTTALIAIIGRRLSS